MTKGVVWKGKKKKKERRSFVFFIAKSRWWWWCETDERRRRRRIHTLLSETRFVDQGPHIPNSRKKGREKRKIRGSGKHLHHQKNGREEKKLGGERHHPKDLLHCTRKKGAAIDLVSSTAKELVSHQVFPE